MHAAAPSSTADVVLDVARAVCDLAGPPTASFLKQHHVDLANDAERDVHSHSARFQEVAGMYPSDRHSDLLPPVDTPRWTSSGSAMTSLLCGCAWEIVRYFVQQNSIATPPTAVHRYTQPLDQDPWHYTLGLAPWGAARPYGVEYLLGVGDGPISSLEYNLVGCVVPVRTTLEADQPLHKCELFCALTLLHRQLKFHGCFDLSVRPSHCNCSHTV